jgi:acyl-CoA oxidase
MIGDCGPKFGLNAVDNGFILFHHFRIPVGNLLDKVSGINEKGEFFSNIEGENKRFGMTLAALSEGRLFMCCHSTALGISALTIALRYAYVRRQFSNKKGEKEVLLIDYPLTKRRMIPLLAQ